jgi:septal ring factor EnvC (AmiA/AmiB activator)
MKMNNFIKFTRTVFTAFIGLAFILAQLPVAATLQDDLAAVQKRLADIRNQKSTLQKQINSDKSISDQYTAEIIKLKDQIDLLDNQIQEKDLTIQELNLQIDILTQTIDSTTTEITKAESNIGVLEEETDKRMVDIYIQEKTFSNLDMFFKQGGSDIIKFSVYQNSFQQETNNMLQDLNSKKADLSKKKGELEANKIQIVTSQTQLDAEKIALTETQSTLDQQRAEYYKKRSESQARIQQNASQVNLYSDAEAKALAQQNLLEQQIFNTTSNLTNGTYVLKGTQIANQGWSGYVIPSGSGGAHLHFGVKVNGADTNPCSLLPSGQFSNCAGNGTLSWPLKGTFYYTSSYGGRYINGKYSFHYAIDIASRENVNAPVYAAQSGYLYKGGSQSAGYWRKICESKTNCNSGLYTFYLHLKN